MDALTVAARATLRAEVQRRGLSGQQLEKLHARELHREARFDQKERVRRKKMLLDRLTRLTRDPMKWIWALLFVSAFLLLQHLWRQVHH